MLPVEPLEEMLRQREDVLPPVPQGGEEDGDHVEPVVEVLPERAPRHHLFQVGVRRRDDPDVHGYGPVLPEALERPFLQNAQQLHLRGQRDVAHLVEEDRAAGRLLEPAFPLLDRAGEGAPLVAEQLRLEQRLGEGGAVDGDEGAVRAASPLVDRAGDHLLPRPALAAQQHRGARRRDAGHRGEDLLHPLALPDDVLDPVRLADRLLEFLPLPPEFVLQAFDRLVQLQRLPDEAADHGEGPRVRFERPGPLAADPFRGQHPQRLGADLDRNGEVGERPLLGRHPVRARLVQERRLAPDVREGDGASRLHRLPDDPLAPDVPAPLPLLRGVAGGDLHPDLARRLVGAEDGGAVESEEALERAQGDPQRAVEVLRRGEDLGHLVDGRDLGLLGGSGIGHAPIIAQREKVCRSGDIGFRTPVHNRR